MYMMVWKSLSCTEHSVVSYGEFKAQKYFLKLIFKFYAKHKVKFKKYNFDWWFS